MSDASGTGRKRISYVFPIYNEEGNIPLLYTTLLETIAPVEDRYDFEFVFVNDGSRDRSLALLTELAERDPRVVVVDFARNYGHQLAVTAGIDVADGDALVIMDSDMQDPPRVSLELIERWEAGADVVYAQRRTRKDSAFKRATAHGFYWTLSKLASIDIPRNTGDFRLISATVADELRKYREHSRFLRGMVSYVGFRQEAVEFDRDARHAGETGYPLSKMIRFAADGILSFSVVPLQIISRLGELIAALSFVAFLYVALLRIFNPDAAVPGWAFLASGIFLLGGLQLVMLGLLGAYIGRIYTEVQGRPLYGVRTILRGQERTRPYPDVSELRR